MILAEHLPGPHSVRDLLEGLGLRDCEVEPGGVPGDPCAVAVYVGRGTERPAAALFVDLPLAASLGAAIVGIPRAVVDESVAGGVLDDALVENVHEVVNVLASLISSPGTPGVQLAGVSMPGEAHPAAVAEVLAANQRRSFGVSMRGYPGGTMSLHGTL